MKKRKSISIRFLFVNSFIVIIIFTIVTMCFALLSNWKASNDDIIVRMESDSKRNILSQINMFVASILRNNQANFGLVENVVDMKNSQEREKFFLSVLNANSKEVYSFTYGTETGEYYGARRNEKGEMEIVRNNKKTNGHSFYYSVKPNMSKGKFLMDAGEFDPRTRDWYISAKSKGKATFSAPYKHFIMNDLTISAAYPIYAETGGLKGVLGTHIILSKLNNYLKNATKDKNATAFIVEQETGDLIANSINLNNFIEENGIVRRINIRETGDKSVLEAFDKYKDSSVTNQKVKADGDTIHVGFSEFDKEGLNWLIITAIPESQLTGHIERSIRIALVLSLLILLISIFIFNKYTGIILKPIWNLIQITEKYSKGDLSQKAEIFRNDEAGKLSNAFNDMAQKLNNLINSLEDKVRERTQELEKANLDLKDAIARAEAASNEKSRFLASMSHEIRTPMNGIIGYLQLLETSKLNDEQREFVQSVKDSADTLLSIVNDILDISKIESGKVELEHITFNIHETVKKTILSFEAIAHEKGLEVNQRIDPKIPSFLNGDPLRLRQVLSNLISNAVKFTERGSVDVDVSFISEMDNFVNVHFRVRDTGIGLTEEELVRIFQPFTQADSSTTRKYGGTGLGLSISSNIIRLMGGEISVSSEKRKGSIFEFDVRFEKTNEEGIDRFLADIKSNTEIMSKNISKDLKILLVEDKKTNRTLFKKLVNKLELSCDFAENGEEAVNAYVEKQYDLIFMDCQMPIMDGYEATQKIREIEAETGRHAIIVAMTAYASNSDKDRCLNAGMDEYMTKPVKFDEVIRVIKQYGKIDAYLNVLYELVRVTGFKKKDCEEIIEEFLTQAYGLLKRIREEQNNDNRLISLHQLKGSAGNIRAEDIRHLAADAENAYRAENHEKCHQLLNQIEGLLNELTKLKGGL